MESQLQNPENFHPCGCFPVFLDHTSTNFLTQGYNAVPQVSTLQSQLGLANRSHNANR